MNDVATEQSYFDELVSWASGQLKGEEVLLASWAGEKSDFVRFNNGDVRQAGTVQQTELSVDLIEGSRHTAGSVGIAQDRGTDEARLSRLLGQPPIRRRTCWLRLSSPMERTALVLPAGVRIAESTAPEDETESSTALIRERATADGEALLIVDPEPLVQRLRHQLWDAR